MKRLSLLLAVALLLPTATGCRVYHSNRTIEYVEVNEPGHYHDPECGHMLMDGVWVEPVIVEEQVVGPNPWAIAGGIILGAMLHHSFHGHHRLPLPGPHRFIRPRDHHHR
ncbi:MAG: hypothetical protein AAB074_02045 [Planctomycetota bacterium]